MNELARYEFTPSEWPNVQGFDCGDEPYEKEVSEWLKGPSGAGIDSALNSISDPARPSRLWLYKLGEEVVRFGALSKTTWRWPGKNNDPTLPLSIIIWFAVQKAYWGQPPGPKDSRYSAVILDDLIAEARLDAKTHPVLGLFVHKDNERAIRFYKGVGFNDDLVQRVENTGMYKMFIVLDDVAFEEAVEKVSGIADHHRP